MTARVAAGNLPALAADLVEQHPDVLVAPVIAEPQALHRLTSTIPIVTLTPSDPVGSGLAASLERPGSNVTGVIQQPPDFNAERLKVLQLAVPGATRIAVLANAANAEDPALDALRGMAAPLGLELIVAPVQTADQLADAFATASAQSADAMMVLAGTLFTANRAEIIRLANESGLPAMYPSRLSVDDGGSMDLAYVEAERGLRAAEYVYDILHGANPAEMPMQPPPDTELVLNRATARAIGFSAPAELLARATNLVP